MRLLVLGGTKFLGRHSVVAALERGWEVTLFHRGSTNPRLFPDLEHVLGDRDGGLDALGKRRWDAVLDTSGYVPRVVGQAARRLADSVERYAFVSSISVYARVDRAGLDEDAPVAALADASVEEITGETYGALKAACEREVVAAFGDRALVVRPGLIVGPEDPTDRFGYWPRRFHRGGDVLAPAPPESPVQFVDARDLAGWMLHLIEARVGGTYHATGPAEPLDLGGVLEACRVAAGREARVVWVDEAFLLERGVTPWTELPLWVPAAASDFARIDCSRARAVGLRFRPLADTVRDTLDWELAHPLEARPPRPALGGPGPLEASREAELLGEWAAQTR
jgi:2'-hydroxyisoflavone reductase